MPENTIDVVGTSRGSSVAVVAPSADRSSSVVVPLQAVARTMMPISQTARVTS